MAAPPRTTLGVPDGHTSTRPLTCLRAQVITHGAGRLLPGSKATIGARPSPPESGSWGLGDTEESVPGEPRWQHPPHHLRYRSSPTSGRLVMDEALFHDPPP
jgi:hypothetical protein